jgi:predicted CXXCH cytochrome family protein
MTRSRVRVQLRFLYPLTELCVTCHTDKSDSAARASGVWLHGPVQSGWCTACHSPHAAEYPHVVKQLPDITLCGECHQQNELREVNGHELDSNSLCTSCHDPHSGSDRMLLRAQGAEQDRDGEA